MIRRRLSSDIGDILERAIGGERPSADECLELLKSGDIHLLGEAGLISRWISSVRMRRTYGPGALWEARIVCQQHNAHQSRIK